MTFEERYPNLQAVLDGRVSGSCTEWPAVRKELFMLKDRLEKKLTEECDCCEAPCGTKYKICDENGDDVSPEEYLCCECAA